MEEWHLRSRDLKQYPHFDTPISAKDAEDYVKNAGNITHHKFFPFLRYVVHWTSYADKGEVGKAKNREIRYAARRDSYTFSYYRHLLSIGYEAELKKRGLDQSILAYRRIPKSTGIGGKCNIDFALDAAVRIGELKDCCAVALDISQFFESLDHEQLKKLWCRMLGKNKLPNDHFQVFKAITRYAIADKLAVYERLGYYGPKRKTKTGKMIPGYLSPYKSIPKQLCSPADFRKKVAGSAGYKSIIEVNYKPYGIPQGAPISDLLANLYLLDFDIDLSEKLKSIGGSYYRYSDDILLLAPGDQKIGLDLEEFARKQISKYGDHLQIKESKSSVVAYKVEGGRQIFSLIKGEQGKHGLEYLGFRFDGHRIYIRNSTIQNLYRKVTFAARREAMMLAKRYPNRSQDQLKAGLDYDAFVGRFGRVEDFNELHDDYRKWTFWTYAQRAASTMGKLGSPIRRQLRKQRDIIRAKLDAEFARAVERRRRNSTIKV